MHLLFDLDGTIIDPYEGITRSLEYSLTRCGVASPGREQLSRFIGPPLRAAFRELLKTQDRPYVDRAVGYYRERFAEVGVYENTLYPGMDEVLADVFAAGYRLYVATSKPTDYAQRIIERHTLHPLFTAVHGSEFDGTNAVKGDLIAHLMRQHELLATETIMIGDRSQDIVAAHSNGLCSVGVVWGYGDSEELLAAGATVLCESPADLPGGCLAALEICAR